MKITKEQLQYMQIAIEPFCTSQLTEHINNVKKEGKYKDLDTRIMFDLFYVAKLSKYACDTLYKCGCNDNHIETALMQIKKNLNLYF